MTSCLGSCHFCLLYFVGIIKEPSFISKRRVPYHDPQISKSLEWNGAVSEKDAAASAEPEALGAQEAERREGVNRDEGLSLGASRVPKRTRSHSADSRAEGASDPVENKEDSAADHTPVNENVDPEHSTKLLSENIDNGVGVLAVFLFKSIDFFVDFIVISVIITFCA